MSATASDSPAMGRASADVMDQSFFEGGGLDQLLQRVRLSGDAPRQVRRRIGVFVLVTWAPLLLLSTLAGQAVGPGPGVPFLLDIEVHVRLLLALPLLLLADVEVHHQLPRLMLQFRERRLLNEQTLQRFESAIASAARLRSSVLSDVVIATLVYGVGIMVVWRHYGVLDTATWYGAPSASGPVFTPAGLWYGFVSMPIMQFLLLRWYFRIVIWARLLWQVSRIPLDLVPAHPDRAGGLGFLTLVVHAFGLLAVAHGTIAGGQVAGRIFFAGARLSEFADPMAALVVWVLFIVCGPMLFFAGQLRDARRAGLATYGRLAERYVRGFDRKWLADGRPVEAIGEERLLGTADIQSLADLANGYQVVQTMRVSPVSHRMVLHLAVATLAPMTPLLLTAFPLNELLKMLLGVPH